MSNKQASIRKNLARLIRIFLPFIILLFLFGALRLINLGPPKSTAEVVSIAGTANPDINNSPYTAESAPEATENDQDFPTTSEIPEGSQVIQSTELPATETPIPEELQITLLGPPEESEFHPSEAITFYWSWPLALGNDQIFELIFTSGADDGVVGSVAEAALGANGFQLRITPNDDTGVDDVIHWYVQLKNPETGNILRTSDNRKILIAKDEN